MMHMVCISGGPAGLYLGLLMKRRHPEHGEHGASCLPGGDVIFEGNT
jgi:hypothetical protein